jgi:hypothetical protein
MLDLSLTVVPHAFETLVKKAHTNADYAEWLAFANNILKGNDFDEFDDREAEAVKKDVLRLKRYHDYTPIDFFYDEHNSSDTLDYLINDEIEARSLDVPTGILWEWGKEIDPHCKSNRGLPLKIYTSEEVKKIFGIIGKLSFKDLAKHYDDEKPVAFGVHRMQAGNQQELARDFERIKTIFKRASEEKGAFVLKKID